jgi:hypothetical protein
MNRIRACNARAGSLSTPWDGTLPGGYSPIRKQGAIVLGSGGDCGKSGRGRQPQRRHVRRGCDGRRHPSDATENAVQADVVAAGYAAPAGGQGQRIVGTQSGRCLDSPNTTTNGTQLQLWDRNGQTNQRWSLRST